MMKRLQVVLVFIFMAGLLSAANSQPVASKPKPIEEMSADELMQVLNRANLLARPYYNGVPDPAATGRGYNEQKRQSRTDVLKKLSKIIMTL